jgi:WD40 repeat protein
MLLLQGHTKPVVSVSYSPTGGWMVSRAWGGGMCLWDLAARQPRLWDMGGGKRRMELGPLDTVVFTPDGKHLFVTDDDDGWAYLIDVKTGNIRKVLPDHDPPGSFTFARGGKRCVRYGWSDQKDVPTLEWWKYPSWKLYRTWDIFSDEAEKFDLLAFGPKDSILAGMNADGVDLYDVATGKRRARRPFKLGRGRPFLTFHPDGRRLAVGWGKRVTILDVETVEAVAELKSAKKPFLDGAFTPDGRWLLTASNEEAVTVWDTAVWKQATQYAWGIGPVACVAVAPDGMTAAAGGKGGSIVLWDLDY